MIDIKAIAVFAVLAYLLPASAQPSVAVEKPEVSVGESWIYTGHENENNFTFTVKVDQVSEKEIRALVTRNGMAEGAVLKVFDRQWNLIEILNDGKRIVRYSPYLPTFSFPLEVGKEWGQYYDWRREDRNSDDSPAKTWAERLEHNQVGLPITVQRLSKVRS